MVPLRSTICNAISYKKMSMASEESLILTKVCEKPSSCLGFFLGKLVVQIIFTISHTHLS